MVNGWANAKLEDVLDYIQPSDYIVNSTEYSDKYKTPVLTAGKSFVIGYTNETNNLFDRLPAIIFDDFTTSIQFVNFRFKVKSSAMKILVPTSRLVDIRYVFYLMKTLRVNTDTHKRFWISIFSQLPIKIAPSPEQKVIANQIEEMFSDLDNAIENLKKAQEQLKVYRQAVLKCAFEGKFIEDVDNWQECKIEDIIKDSLIGLVRSLKEQNDKGVGIPYVKMDCIDLDGNVDMSKVVFIQAREEEIKKYKLEKGDVLLNTRNSYELVGKTGIVKDDSSLRIFNNNILRMRFKENADPYFICYQLISPDIRGKMVRGKKATTNVCALYQKDLFPITVRIPSLKIQKKIVQEIDKRLSVCDNMTGCIEGELFKAESLRQSILKQAFEGKLTEQWRKEHKDSISGENSAEALLKKIKTEKEDLQVKLKGKKKRD